MERIDYLAAQTSLAKTMRRVCETEQAIAIDGAGKDQVVMLSLQQYQALAAQCCAPETESSPQRQGRP
ncbi:hypothetical protein GCM10008090_15650 [Arenicella chitinivorans]|uniref:Uncharacterized protein n=1 Tax=Arenicella chitinivorans TaxID=1329800 RepID=A0A918RPR6_9GAMM|nr:hypothetical protein [Arenicella chitinivorans]GHA06837.1 hypothetical protein GCM10008090_15650 [Arenicella chitinivorans]